MRKYLLYVLAAVTLSLSGVTAGAKGESLGLMSFNLSGKGQDDTGEHGWEARKKACVKALRKYHPDVVFFQDAYSHHKSFLMKEFPKYLLVDRSSKPGTIDQELGNNENPIMFRADRLELLNYGSFYLNESQNPDSPGWDASAPRNVTWIKLRFKKSGLIFFCFNTKFDDAEAARKGSAEVMVDKIKEIAGDDAVVFLGGDFRMSASDRSLSTLASYMKDVNFSLKKPDTRASFNGYGHPGSAPLWPDHIFLRNAKAEAYEVVDGGKFGVKFISDHYPVFAEATVSAPKRK